MPISRSSEEILAAVLGLDAAAEIVSTANNGEYNSGGTADGNPVKYATERETTDGALIDALTIPMAEDSYAYCEIVWLWHDQTSGGLGAMQKSWATFNRLGSADAVVDNEGIFVGSNNDGIPGATFVDVSGANLVVQLQGDGITFDTLEWKVFVTVWTLNF